MLLALPADIVPQGNLLSLFAIRTKKRRLQAHRQFQNQYQ